jgi:hypothetical protein
MSQPEVTGKIILLQPSDASAKITDVVEGIIAGIMETGEVNVVGFNEALFLTCSSVNMATEIAKVYVDDIDIADFDLPGFGRVFAVSAHLTQKMAGEYTTVAAQEDKTMTDADQTISVSRASTFERLITISLLKLVKFDKVKIAAAGGSINDAITLALKLTGGQISKDPVGIKLFHLYSITMRDDPTKSIAAVSIYLQKGVTKHYTKRQLAILKEISTVNSANKK